MMTPALETLLMHSTNAWYLLTLLTYHILHEYL